MIVLDSRDCLGPRFSTKYKGDLQNHHDDLVVLPYSKKLWWGKGLAKTRLLMKKLCEMGLQLKIYDTMHNCTTLLECNIATHVFE